jgi:hypothetical protein
MRYGVCGRNCNDEDLATTTAYLAEIRSGVILLDAYTMNFREARLASAIL